MPAHIPNCYIAFVVRLRRVILAQERAGDMPNEEGDEAHRPMESEDHASAPLSRSSRCSQTKAPG